jgi:hypothetical protein
LARDASRRDETTRALNDLPLLWKFFGGTSRRRNRCGTDDGRSQGVRFSNEQLLRTLHDADVAKTDGCQSINTSPGARNSPQATRPSENRYRPTLRTSSASAAGPTRSNRCAGGGATNDRATKPPRGGGTLDACPTRRRHPGPRPTPSRIGRFPPKHYANTSSASSPNCSARSRHGQGGHSHTSPAAITTRAAREAPRRAPHPSNAMGHGATSAATHINSSRGEPNRLRKHRRHASSKTPRRYSEQDAIAALHKCAREVNRTPWSTAYRSWYLAAQPRRRGGVGYRPIERSAGGRPNAAGGLPHSKTRD